MKKSTALEILRRYADYSIVTVSRPDICDVLVDANGQPFYDTVNLVYLWALKNDEMPFEGPESKEFPVRDYFALESFADYLKNEKEGQEFSPWSTKGYLGGYISTVIGLLPPDLDRVLHLFSSSVTRSYIHWTPEDDANDRAALDKGRLYADMGDWSPARIAFDPDALRLDWESNAGAECLRKGEIDGFWVQWDVPKENDDEIDIVAEMGKMLADPTSSEFGAQSILSTKDAEHSNGGLADNHLNSNQARKEKTP